MCNRNIIIIWFCFLYDCVWDLFVFCNDVILKIINKFVFVYYVICVVKFVNLEEI